MFSILVVLCICDNKTTVKCILIVIIKCTTSQKVHFVIICQEIVVQSKNSLFKCIISLLRLPNSTFFPGQLFKTKFPDLILAGVFHHFPTVVGEAIRRYKIVSHSLSIENFSRLRAPRSLSLSGA